MASTFANSIKEWRTTPFEGQGRSLACVFDAHKGMVLADQAQEAAQDSSREKGQFEVLDLAAGQTSFRDRMLNLVKAGQIMKAVTSIRHALEKADLSDPRVHNAFKDLVADVVSQLSDAQDKVLGEHLAKLIDLKPDANDPKLKSANNAMGLRPPGLNVA